MPLEVQIVTPENIVIRWPVAGPVSRAVAFLNDLAYQAILMAVGGIAIGIVLENIVLGRIIGGCVTASSFFIFWGYHTFFEVFNDGRTPGKKQTGLKVVTVEGQPVEFFPSMIRNLVRVVDFLPFGFVTGLFAMLIGPRQQRLGDLLARTIVIYDQPVKEELPR